METLPNELLELISSTLSLGDIYAFCQSKGLQCNNSFWRQVGKEYLGAKYKGKENTPILTSQLAHLMFLLRSYFDQNDYIEIDIMNRVTPKNSEGNISIFYGRQYPVSEIRITLIRTWHDRYILTGETIYQGDVPNDSFLLSIEISELPNILLELFQNASSVYISGENPNLDTMLIDLVIEDLIGEW